MTDYQPGDVVRWDEKRRAMLIGGCERSKHPSKPHWHLSDGLWSPSPLVPGSPIRPLVVIDPEDGAQVERLERARWEAMGGDWDDLPLSTRKTRVERMQAALREYVKPSTPAEPTMTGALVRDRDGALWARAATDGWICLTRPDLDQSWDGLCGQYGPVEVVRDE